jgi:hypothetical protein
VADTLRGEQGLDVEVVDGNRGELTVAVDGRTVAKKSGNSMPSPEEVRDAVRQAHPVST